MKKISGSPRYLVIGSSELFSEFAAAIHSHLGSVPNGPNSGMNLGPCQHRIKIIFREFIDMRSIINGSPNVSQSPANTLKRLEKVQKMAVALSRELSDIGMHDQDTDEAIFYAVESFRGRTKGSGIRVGHKHEINEYVRFLGIAARKAISDIQKFKEPGKKFSHWPGHVEPEQQLIMDLAALYHHQKGDVEKRPWETAGDACKNTGSDTKEYRGPFFDLVLDCFEVLGIEKACSNRNLGEYIKRALKRWEEIHTMQFKSEF